MRMPSKKRILLVEDDAIIALSTARTLGKFGHEVVVSHEGEDAVRLASVGAPFDLILMDIDLGPGLDGPAAAQRILGSVTLPIVFLTSHAEREMVERVHGITRYGYIIKNSGDFVLRSSIDMALELFDANRRLQSIFRVAPTGIGVVCDRIIVEANPRLCEMTGFPPAELIGRSARMLYPTEEDFAYVGKEKYRQIAAKGSGEVETRWRRKDGAIIDVLLASTPIDTNDLSQGVTFTALDITERKRAGKALRESEEYLSTTIQSIGDGVIATDAAGGIARMNLTAERLTGWSFEDAKGRPLSEVFRIVNADTREAVANPVHRVLAEGCVVGLANHTVLLGRNGGEYQIADSAAPIRDEGGAVRGVILVFSDVTEKYQTDRKIQENERRMKSIVESAPSGMHMYELRPGRGLVFSGANPAADSILGTDNSAFIGKTIEEAFPPLAATEVPARYRQVAEHGGIWKTEQLEYDDRKIKGAFEVVAFQTAPGCMTAMFSDITARKQAEEELGRKTEELEDYFLASLDLFCIAGTDGRFIKLNRQWEKALGYPLEELQGSVFLDYVHPEDLESTLQTIGRLERREEVLDFVNRYRCKDGSYKWIEWRSILRRDRIYAAARDITAHRVAEEKIGSLLAEKELILREVHHRIKNNMTTMVSLLSLQADMVPDPQASAALQDAKGRLQSMGVLYEKLYRSDDVHALSARDYLVALAREIIALFPNSRGVRLEESVEDFPVGVKQLSLVGIIVNEVLTNTLRHAFLGREGGVITLAASARDGHVRFLLGDDGAGMPESVAFPDARSFGLQLVSMLSQQLGGSIRLERDGGTRFILEFDAARE
jgi:PAS domain S-box-containing protein